MEVTRIFELLNRYETTFKPKDDVLAGKENGQWVKHDLAKYKDTANNVSYALMSLGVRKGDKVATISNNRPEWTIDSGEITANLKLKRSYIQEKYKDQIDELFV